MEHAPELNSIIIVFSKALRFWELFDLDCGWTGEMKMEKELRLEAFERMLAAVQADYDSTTAKMRTLKEAGKEKTATYRQLMGHKLELQNVLALYRVYGLLENAERPQR